MFPKFRKTISSVAAFPSFVHVETTNHCNAQCPMCPQKNMQRARGVMADELYQKILDECATHKDTVKRFVPYMQGEPLTDPDIFARIKVAKERGMKHVFLSTNAGLLNQERTRTLLESGLDSLRINFDGGSPASYEKMRYPLKYEDVSRNIAYLIKQKRLRRRTKPEIVLSFIETDINRGEYPLVRKQWAGRADMIVWIPAHNYSGQVAVNTPRAAYNPCIDLWHKISILVNGDAALCCLDYEGQIILGNVREKSIAELWNSPQMNEVRNGHLAGEVIPFCRKCSELYRGRSDRQLALLLRNEYDRLDPFDMLVKKVFTAMVHSRPGRPIARFLKRFY